MKSAENTKFVFALLANDDWQKAASKMLVKLTTALEPTPTCTRILIRMSFTMRKESLWDRTPTFRQLSAKSLDLT